MNAQQYMSRIRRNRTGRPLIDLTWLEFTAKHDETNRMMVRHDSTPYAPSIDNMPSYSLDRCSSYGDAFQPGPHPLVVT